MYLKKHARVRRRYFRGGERSDNQKCICCSQAKLWVGVGVKFSWRSHSYLPKFYKISISPTTSFKPKITYWIFSSLRADNPTHLLLNPPCFPWFAQGSTPGASWWHVHRYHAHHLPHFSWPYRTPILIMQCTIFLSHFIYMFDWLILRQEFSEGGGWRVRGSGWWVTGDGWRTPRKLFPFGPPPPPLGISVLRREGGAGWGMDIFWNRYNSEKV